MTTILNRRRRKSSLRIVAFLLIFLVMGGVAFFFRDALGSMVWRVAGPALSLREQAGVNLGLFFAQFKNSAMLAEENNRLKSQLASTSILLMDRNLLKAENEDLKTRLGRSPQLAPILAAVVMRPPGTPYDTLMLGAGKNVGIEGGDMVAAGGGVYIGWIESSFDSAARVVLFSSPGQTYEGMLRGTIPISLKGQGAGSIVGELPIGTEVAVGDDILLPQITPSLAAKVVNVIQREGESFKFVYLTLPVNPFELRFVEIHRSN